MKVQQGVYCSWRIQADEYYGVSYNLYRDGTKLNSEPLSVSNFTDASGSASSHYTVKAVINGKEQEESTAASVWSNDYLEITPKHDASLKSTYIPNDACCADVDGDGVVEILLKYDNSEESSNLFPKNGNNGEYSLFECLKLDGTVLWWVNCGPNMGDFQNNEQNIVGYDWDGDRKAEVVMRLSEGASIHMADGTTYTIGADGKNGTNWTNYRKPKDPNGVEWFTYYGNEFLLYVEGATGIPYQCISFPCARYEAGETDLNKAWGDGYGHRSSKYFFGAPYLDGKKPSIFIGRGIYTRHKFVALDVNPETHQLTERWRWMNNTPGPWYGQGYHNYSIADVDWDGRDEIIWGSMVIDDNGKGLSTTGLGHGDAHHVGDLDPYRHGQEGFFCNEDKPANNYRDLTTSKIYYRMTDTEDAGRAIAGNFSNDFPGAIGWGAHDSPISLVTDNHVTGMSSSGMSMNFRIYWDGDLQEENYDNITVSKYGTGTIISHSGAVSNNSTKATPCFQGDILGDWREETILRTTTGKIRIYTSTIPTKWRNYSLWYDHQYRNAMVWQMCGYNQPPHVSYFLGELENITIAPPPLINHGRELVGKGGSISAAHNDKHVLVYETEDASINVEAGSQPEIVTFNVPSWVRGSAPSECTVQNTTIYTSYYTLNVTGAGFSGNTRLVKQGDGILTLPKETQTYTGSTDIWAGTLNFDGNMQNSHVWLNRFAELNSNGGNFQRGIQADYGSIIRAGGEKNVGTLTTDSLALGFGARIVFDVATTGSDELIARALSIEKKDWKNGPTYSAPIFEFICSEGKLAAGKYQIAEIEKTNGSIEDIIIEGLDGQKKSLVYEEGKLYLIIPNSREPEVITWTGTTNSIWDLDNTANFTNGTDALTFVSDDEITFNDNTKSFNVSIDEEVNPAKVIFDNSKAYTISGTGAIAGNASLTLKGSGSVKINNVNTYTGGTYIQGGTLIANTLANKEGSANGSCGNISSAINLDNKGTLQVSANITTSHPIKLGTNGGTINVSGGTMIVNGSISKINAKGNLYKAGAGTLQLNCTANFDTLFINRGEVYDFQDQHFNGKVIAFPGSVTRGATYILRANNSYGGSSTDNMRLYVPSGAQATFYPDGRCDYTGALTGAGTLNVYSTFVRCYFKGNWSAFTGTINAYWYKSGSYNPQFQFSNTYGLGKATLNVTSGVTVEFGGSSFAIGELTGPGTVTNASTLTIGGKNTNFKFDGVINGPAVNKTGSGIWTIDNTATLATAGAVTVKQGTLKLNCSTSATSSTGAKTLLITSGGELTGKGAVSSLAVYSESSYRPGIGSSQGDYIGTIRSLGNISINEGANVYLFKKDASDVTTAKSYIDCASGLDFKGTLHLTYGNDWKPAAGDTCTIFIAKSITGTPTFDLQALPDGLAWDTTTVMKDGVLRVVSTNGISKVSIAEAPRCEVFNAAGVLVASMSIEETEQPTEALREAGFTPGIYILRIIDGEKKETHKVVLR